MTGAAIEATAADPSAPLIFLIAGEPSGDAIGAHLMAALREQSGGHIRFTGIGGERMTSAGLDSLFPMSDLSLFGAAEVIPKAPMIFRRVRETLGAIRASGAVAVVSIDVPGFAFRVLERLRPGEVLRIHYVAPTVWAYRPGRARKIAAFLEHLLVLLPFEPPYFEAVGLPCTYVGHPILEEGADRGDGPGFRARHGIPPDAPLLAVLPGSRHGEVKRLLPVFRDAVRRLADRFANLHTVIPAVAAVAEQVTAAASTWPVPVIVVPDRADKFNAFAASNGAISASGSVSLELGQAGVPMVIAYKLNPITVLWARLIIRVKFVTLINLIVDRLVVPEFLQQRCTPQALANALAQLLQDGPVRRAQIAGIREAMDGLGAGAPAPSSRAAAKILEVTGIYSATASAASTNDVDAAVP